MSIAKKLERRLAEQRGTLRIPHSPSLLSILHSQGGRRVKSVPGTFLAAVLFSTVGVAQQNEPSSRTDEGTLQDTAEVAPLGGHEPESTEPSK